MSDVKLVSKLVSDNFNSFASMATIKREGKRKRELRNLIKRGRVWYWKKMVDGSVKLISLETEDLELAKARRNAKENELTNTALAKIAGARSTAGTLQQVFEHYRKVGGLTHKSLEGNISMMMRVVRVGLGKETIEPEDVRLDVLTPKLVRDYQDAVRAEYEAAAGKNEKERRIARDSADRTTRSVFNQAKSIFCRSRQMIERYREAGISVPKCVEEFRATQAVGTMTSKIYFPASDEVLKTTFTKIDELKASDPDAYNLFWCSLATGARRGEVADMKVADMVELDGHLWVGAGLGKDGQPIQIPVINWPVHPDCATIPADVVRELMLKRKEEKSEQLLAGHRTERYDWAGDRLNAWLASMGWRDEKKLHAVRSYIGCKIFARNPRLAQLYLRHKSITTTENFYSQHLKLRDVLTLSPEIAPPIAAVQASGPVAA
jgi:Phage integrase family.